MQYVETEKAKIEYNFLERNAWTIPSIISNQNIEIIPIIISPMFTNTH